MTMSKGARKILIFDEATSNLNLATAEQLAQTVNQPKGKATILFIAHIVPRALEVDRGLTLGPESKDTTRSFLIR